MEQRHKNLSNNVRFAQNYDTESNSNISTVSDYITPQLVARQQTYYDSWYKPDNAALLYALTSAHQQSSAVFAMSVLTKDKVDALKLQQAVNDICPRFPTIAGTVKQGLFWHYIDQPTVPLVVQSQSSALCSAMPVDGYQSQIRVTYYGNRINVEFFHTATDGTGAITFLNSLVARYLILCGHNIEHYINCKQCDNTVTVDEVTDKFPQLSAGKTAPKAPKSVLSARLQGKKLPYGNFLTYRIVCNTEQLLSVTRSKQATVTELLGACALLAIKKHASATKSHDKHPIRILVPVDFRRRYTIDTMRNFAGYTFIQYNNQSSLDDVITDVKSQLHNALNNDEYFCSMVSANINTENNALLRLAPLPVKKFAVKSVVKHIGDGKVNCGTLSNIGLVKTPQEFAQHIHRYDFTLGKGDGTINFAVISFGNATTISVTSYFAEPHAAREFFTLIASTGIDVAVEADITEKTL